MKSKHKSLLVGCKFYLKKLIDAIDAGKPPDLSWQTVDVLVKQIESTLNSEPTNVVGVVWHEPSQSWYRAELVEKLSLPMVEEEVY